jgi:hypothetical protein
MRDGSRIVAVCVAALALAGITTVPASAAARPLASPVDFAVLPGRQLVHGIDGKRVPVVFYVEDAGTAPLTVTLSTEGFGEQRMGGMAPIPVPSYERGWLTLPVRTLHLQPKISTRATAYLTLPRRASPGEANLGVLATAVIREPGRRKGTTVRVIARALGEILVTVPGKASRHLAYSLAGGGFSLGGAVALTATVTEHGTDYAVLNGQRIRGGGASIPLPGVLLLAGSTRAMSTSWQPPAFCMPCRLSYGTASADVWSLPGLDLLGGLLILLALAGIGLYLRRNRRRASARRHGRGKPLATP